MSKENTARTSVDIATDEEAVWEALTTDEGLAPWMGEGATIDAVAGGSLTVADPVGGQPRQGTVEVAEPARQLDFCWWPSDRPIETTRVSIVLVPIESGTRVTVTETAPSARFGSIRAEATGRASAGPVLAGSLSSDSLSPDLVSSAPVLTAPMLKLACWSWRFAALSLACRLVRC